MFAMASALCGDGLLFLSICLDKRDSACRKRETTVEKCLPPFSDCCSCSAILKRKEELIIFARENKLVNYVTRLARPYWVPGFDVV